MCAPLRLWAFALSRFLSGVYELEPFRVFHGCCISDPLSVSGFRERALMELPHPPPSAFALRSFSF